MDKKGMDYENEIAETFGENADSDGHSEAADVEYINDDDEGDDTDKRFADDIEVVDSSVISCGEETQRSVDLQHLETIDSELSCVEDSPGLESSNKLNGTDGETVVESRFSPTCIEDTSQREGSYHELEDSTEEDDPQSDGKPMNEPLDETLSSDVITESEGTKDEQDTVKAVDDDGCGHTNRIFESSGEYFVDEVMRKRRMENRRNRKRDSQALTNSDDVASHMVERMRICAEMDRKLNEERKPAINKLKYLPTVQDTILKCETGILLENNLLRGICDWLSPMPDRSLPNVKIRKAMIDALISVGRLNSDLLRESGIGKAVMYLAKHPRECHENQVKLWKLINEWSRAVFNLDSQDESFSKEERQKRDIDQQPDALKKRRGISSSSTSSDISKAFGRAASSPHDSSGCGVPLARRAVAPKPAACDYVYRPTSRLNEVGKIRTTKLKSDRIDRMRRKVQDIHKKSTIQTKFKPSF